MQVIHDLVNIAFLRVHCFHHCFWLSIAGKVCGAIASIRNHLCRQVQKFDAFWYIY